MNEDNQLQIEGIVKKRKYTILFLILIGITGFVIRLYFLPFDLVLNNDSATYFWYANDVSILGRFPIEISANIDTQFPNNGWPTFLSVFFSLVNSENFLDYMNAQRVISVLISVLTIIPIYYLSRKFFNRTYSIIAVSLFCFEPRLIENSLLGVTEPIYLLLGIVTLTLFLNKNNKIILISFATAALFSLIRYEGLLIIIPMTIMYFVRFHKNKKQIMMYIIALGIFVIILFPMGMLRTESTGDNGLTSHIVAGGEYYSGTVEDEGNYMLLEFFSKGISLLSKYFLLVSIPLFLICLPYGIFNLIKRKDENKWTLIVFGLVFLIPAFYAYSRGFQDTRYLYIFYPIFCVISIYFIQIIGNKIKKPRIFFVGIITLVIVISLIFLGLTITDFQREKEEFKISLHINEIATSVNRDYESLHFLKWSDSDVLDNFPVLSTQVEQRDRVEIIIIGNKSENKFETMEGYFEFGESQGLTHLVLDNSNLGNRYLQDIFQNEQKYSFLNKIYDSSESGYNVHIKVFEINYNLIPK
jgi:hypothetical protein